jgi:hypothetical protein
MYIRVWKPEMKEWTTFGIVTKVIDFHKTKLYDKIWSASASSMEIREPFVEFEFNNKHCYGFSMRRLVRDLCMPTYEHHYWEMLPYWLYCPEAASDGLETIHTCQESYLSQIAQGKGRKIPSALDRNSFPEVPGVTLDYEKTQVIIEFSKQAPEDPYFTLGELAARGELECRVYKFDHKTYWKSSTMLLIYETHLVG